MTEWRVDVNDGQRVLTESDGLYDAVTVDAFNPFGDYAKAFFDDLEGELFDLFSRGTKVTFEYVPTGGSTVNTDFVGFVVNDFEGEADGAEQLEVEAYTFDQFLRGDEVSADLSGQTISSALETVITNDVPPVDWDASLVSVEDDVELTQSYQGDKVEEFLLSVRQKSAGEIFGVQENLKFFFEVPEIERTSRDIANDQWVTHNINEEGGETKNQVVVSYDDGDQSVTVDNSSDQLQTQDNLGTPGPAQVADSITRPEIDTLNDAIKAGEQFLEQRRSTLTGPVTTFGLTDAAPGDVINVQIDPRGISSDFRIAENRTQWRSETNELTLVEKKGADSDILIEQSKTLKRVENRPRDNAVTPDRVTDTKPTADIDVVGVEFTDDPGYDVEILTNYGRNVIRDSLINESVIASSNYRLVASDTTRRPKRSDDSLPNILESITPSIFTGFTNGAARLIYTDAQFSVSNVSTIALFDTSVVPSKMLAVARLKEPVDNPDARIDIGVVNNTERPKTVVTETGTKLYRDILADNSPTWPQTYAYGSNSSDPTDTDTSLGNQQVTQDLDSVLVGSANNQSGWERVTPDFADDVPLLVKNGELKQAKTTFLAEAEDVSNFVGTVVDSVDEPGALSGDQGVALGIVGDFVEFDFSPDYQIPAGEFNVDHYYTMDNFEGAVEVSLNGTLVHTESRSTNITTENQLAGSADVNQTLSPDEFHTVRIELTSKEAGQYIVDTVQVVDSGDRFGGFNINRSGTFDSNSLTFDGPNEFPELQTVQLNTFETTREIDEADVTSTWDDTSNAQFIELANDGSTFIRTNNSTSASASFANLNTGLDVRLGISRYTSNSQTTPSSGDTTQSVSFLEAFANPDALTIESIGETDVRAILGDSTAVGTTFAEAGLLDSNGDLLTRSLVPEFSKTSDQKVISGERLRFQNP